MIKKVIILLIVIALTYGGYVFAKKQDWLSDEKTAPIDETLSKINAEDLKNLGQDGLEEIKILSEKAKVAGGVAQEFAQDAIKVKENDDKSISDKAFEYGRYIYCQEVVKQYEASSSARQ
jgi:hypothetical protein